MEATMHSKRNMFLNDTWFAVFTAIMFIAGIAEFIICFTTQNVNHLIAAFVGLLGLITYISYKNHDKNLMKGLLGAELMWLLCEEVTFTASVIVTNKAELSAIFGNMYLVYSGLKIISTLVLLFIFTLHFLINADRSSSPSEVLVNQWLSVAMIFLYIVELFFIATYETEDFIIIVLLIFKIFLTLMIVSVESRLDAYRLLRAGNGWVNPDK